MELDSRLSDNLVCPRDKQQVHLESDRLTCPDGHRYPLVKGRPAMLVREAKQIHEVATYSIEDAYRKQNLATREGIPADSDTVDAFVQQAIGATSGIMYKSIIGKLKEYPIPELGAPRSTGSYFLDVGCNWGRWCIAASRLGYNPVGIDSSLVAIQAARRVGQQLDVQTRFIVADARCLPFAEKTFDLAFSYSVLQHFDKGDARLSLSEVRRVLKIGGRSMVQMPNVFGLRCLYHQMRRGFREAKGFEVRYWTLSELKYTFSILIGPSTVSVGGYLSLNAQTSEAHLLPWRYRIVVKISEFLRTLSNKSSVLIYVADSLYVTANRLN